MKQTTGIWKIRIGAGLLAGSLLLAACSSPADSQAAAEPPAPTPEVTEAPAESTSSGEHEQTLSEKLEEEQTPTPTETAAPTPTEDAASTATEEATPTPTPAETLTPEAIGPAATQVLFDAYYTEKNEETAEVIGMDDYGKELWAIDIGKYPSAGVIQCQDIGIANDLYYYVEGGKIVALDLRNGEMVWENKEFAGVSPSSIFDEDGLLYICGLYRPDLFVVDKNGRTVTRVDTYDIGYENPDQLTLNEDTLTIHYAGNNGTLQVDKKTWQVEGHVAPANGYTDDELLELALKFSGRTDAQVEIFERYENEVLIHVFYDLPEEIQSLAWYWIDPRTGEGEDANGARVDLRTVY